MADGSVVALLDGTLIDPAEPLLRPDDLGVLRGEGVFETTLVVDGEPRDLADHLVRLAVSAELTGLVVPAPEHWRRGVDAVLRAWSDSHPDIHPDGHQGRRQMVLRLIASRGPEHVREPVCYVLGAELPVSSRRQRRSGVRVLLLDRGFTVDAASSAPWLLAGAKTLSYGVNMAALRYAREHGADDVIFLASDGTVLEAPTASVVIARGPILITPPDDGILAGITVRRLFRAADAAGWKVRTEPLAAADLHAADGVWLASSARLLAPVVSIDGRPRSNGALTQELAGLLDMP